MNGICETARIALRKTPSYIRECGVSATFVRMAGNMNLGVKAFTSHECGRAERDWSYTMQEYLSKHKLAPRVFAKFDYKEEGGETVYCLVTECIDKTAFGDGSLSRDRKISLEQKLVERLRKVGIDPFDVHWNNWGMLNGKPVSIDVAFFEIEEDWFDDRGIDPPEYPLGWDCAPSYNS